VLELGLDEENTAGLLEVMENQRQRALEKTKDLMEQVASAYRDFPAEGPLQQFNLERLMLEAQLAALRERQKFLGQQEGTIAKNERAANGQQQGELTLRLRQMQAFENLARRRDAFQFGRFQAGVDIRPSDFGLSPTQALQNRLRGIDQAIRQVPMGGGGSAIEAGRLAELQLQRYRTMLELREREAEVQREINQLQAEGMRRFQEALMAAGPGELLRKLAAFRMNANGVNGGQFMAMTPEMREELMMLNPRFSPRMMQLRAEQAGNAAPNEIFLGQLQQVGRQMAENIRLAGAGFIDVAAKGMNDLAAAAQAAVQNLANLEVLRELPGIVNQLRGGPALAPHLPAFNGQNAGVPVPGQLFPGRF
jgi:hypothetical protein